MSVILSSEIFSGVDYDGEVLSTVHTIFGVGSRIEFASDGFEFSNTSNSVELSALIHFQTKIITV